MLVECGLQVKTLQQRIDIGEQAMAAGEFALACDYLRTNSKQIFTSIQVAWSSPSGAYRGSYLYGHYAVQISFDIYSFSCG